MSFDADTHPSTLGEKLYGPQEEHRLRYLIRSRRKEERTDTELIHVLCDQEALDKEKVVHIGTSSTEKRMDVIFDYNNPTHDAAQICAFKTAVRSKKLKEISIPLEIQPYLNKRVENWKSHRENGIKFPIRDVVYPLYLLGFFLSV